MVSAHAENPLPVSRRIDWSAAGIPGGIPNIGGTPCGTVHKSGGDDTSAIQNAINSAACTSGSFVYLDSDVYKITNTVNLSKGVVLRGAGPHLTKIVPSNRAFLMGGGENGLGTAYIDVTAGATKDSTSITISNATGFDVGGYLTIDQENDSTVTLVADGGYGGTCSWCGVSRCSTNHNAVRVGANWGSATCSGTWEGGKRALGQMAKITAKSGNTLTITPPLYWNYIKEPKVLSLKGVVEYAGIENLKIDDSGRTNDWGDAEYSVGISSCAYCWLKNVEIANTVKKGIFAKFAYRNEFRQNYSHHSKCYAGDHGYGMTFQMFSTSNLIENNIFDSLHLSIAREGGGGGNVSAYNFVTRPRYTESCGSVEYWTFNSPLILHGPHPVFDLFEGNVAPKIFSDYYWGTSSHMTAYRNKIAGYDPTYYADMGGYPYHYHAGSNYAVFLTKSNRFANVLGNILGTSGQTVDYEFSGSGTPTESYLAAHPSVYALGQVHLYNMGDAARDLEVKNTLLRWGNADSTHAFSNRWETSELPSSMGGVAPTKLLPASLFRCPVSGACPAPSWWTTGTWPPFGPDPSNETVLLNGTIPAQKCYNDQSLISGGSFNPSSCYPGSAGGSPPAAPNNLRLN